MPRKHRRSSKKGGMFGYEPQPTGLAAVEQTVENTVTDLGTRASNTVSGVKKSFSDWWNGTQSNSFLPTTYGGRKRTSRRKHKGGFNANTPSSGLAAHASSYSGSPTAKPHNLVGGRTRRRRHSKRRH